MGCGRGRFFLFFCNNSFILDNKLLPLKSGRGYATLGRRQRPRGVGGERGDRAAQEMGRYMYWRGPAQKVQVRGWGGTGAECARVEARKTEPDQGNTSYELVQQLARIRCGASTAAMPGGHVHKVGGPLCGKKEREGRRAGAEAHPHLTPAPPSLPNPPIHV